MGKLKSGDRELLKGLSKENKGQGMAMALFAQACQGGWKRSRGEMNITPQGTRSSGASGRRVLAWRRRRTQSSVIPED